MSERWYFPPPSRPRDADGIKARSRSGAIGATWWSKRFTAVLESFGMGTRLSRGKNYARRGQVLNLDVEPGRVAAEVQGSRAKPYRVRLAIVAYGKAEWAKLSEALAANASYLARLLNGEMPDDIETAFTGAGLPLFPQTARELTMDCSCPDYAVPCKHLAAVVYLLAEAFDEDPFLILRWRGRDRDELLDALRAARSGSEHQVPEEPSLHDRLDSFFICGPMPASGTLDATPAPSGAMSEHLRAVPLEVRGVPLADALRPAYEA